MKRAAAAGLKRSRLARQDLSASSTQLDDLDYALQGLSSSAVPVLRQSILEVASICSDARARAALLRSHGVLPRIVAAVASASSVPNDAVYALAFAGLLNSLTNHRALLDDDLLTRQVAQALLRRVEECVAPAGAAKDAPPPPSSPHELDAAWSHVQLLCPDAVAAAAQPGTAAEISAIAQRLCLLGLASCVRASSTACRPIREHKGLHVLPAIIRTHALRAASDGSLLWRREDELEACLEVLELASFPAEACARGGGGALDDEGRGGGTSHPTSAACEPGGRPLDLLPLIHVGELAASCLYGPAMATAAGCAASSRTASTDPAAARSAASPAAPGTPHGCIVGRGVVVGGSGSGGGSRRKAAVHGATPSSNEGKSFEERRARNRHGYRNPDSPRPSPAPSAAASSPSPSPGASAIALDPYACDPFAFSSPPQPVPFRSRRAAAAAQAAREAAEAAQAASSPGGTSASGAASEAGSSRCAASHGAPRADTVIYWFMASVVAKCGLGIDLYAAIVAVHPMLIVIATVPREGLQTTSSLRIACALTGQQRADYSGQCKVVVGRLAPVRVQQIDRVCGWFVRSPSSRSLQAPPSTGPQSTT